MSEGLYARRGSVMYLAGLPSTRVGCEARYLVIGGVFKAATTSLYRYLDDHPEVCGSSINETRFFLDEDYPVPSAHRYPEVLDAYELYFRHCRPGQVRMEATAFYLYSAGTAERLKQSLGDVKVLFVPREPISRLNSCYRYPRQSRGPEFGAFDEYVARQYSAVSNDSARCSANQLAMGRYSEFLGANVEALGEGSMRVMFFEDLVRDPTAFMRRVCRFIGIADDFFEDYQFAVSNA